jgi:hypothetical protein
VHVFQCGRDREGGYILNYFLFKNILKQYFFIFKNKIEVLTSNILTKPTLE